MWHDVRRFAASAYYDATEAALRLARRRRPYASLHVVIRGDLSEQPSEPRLLPLPVRERADYVALLSLLRWARDDADLRAVMIRCEALTIGWAKVQELRRALTELREAGKTVWVYAAQIGLPEYVLATAADRIVMTPTGSLEVAGLSSEVTFIGGALQKLGIEAELIQIGRFKSAAETFTRSGMSPAHREMVESLVSDLYAQAVDTIASARSLTAARVREIIDGGPFTAAEAEQEKLIDARLYEDEACDQMKARFGDLPMLKARDYRSRRGRQIAKLQATRSDGTIGLLHLSGTIRSGETVTGPDGASACGHESIARDLKTLRERDDVKAIVLRVSSPGGSGLASDLIWHEVQRAAAKKPVVVSFGDIAASGGYYVAAAARRIVAEAGTLTGSIGVLAGKAAMRGLFDRLGIAREIVSEGRNATLHSSYLPLTDSARARLQSEAEFFYAEFLAKVAAGRQMSVEAVDAVAQGRVWTGRQALERGLVDEIGGIETAIAAAKELAGLPRDQLVSIDRFPHPRRIWRLGRGLQVPGLQASDLLPWLPQLTTERIWAVLPLRLRFF